MNYYLKELKSARAALEEERKLRKVQTDTIRVRIGFIVWLRNRLIFVGLEQVLSHTEKSCIGSYYNAIFHDS